MAQGKQGYVPPSVQRQMDQHMQRVPANLQKYQSGNTYIPQKAAQQMTDHMKQTMPKHMQEYIEPYMHQQVTAGRDSLDPVRNSPLQERAPTPDLLRRDHSSFGQQFTVDMDNTSQTKDPKNISFSPQYAAAQSNTPVSNAEPNNNSPYDFILKDQQKPKKNLLGGGSFKSRLLIVAGGALVLLIIAIVFISVVLGGNKGLNQQLLEVAQEQTEIIRVSDIGIEKARGTSAKNLATTVKYSVTSSLNDVLAIIKKKSTDKSLRIAKDSSTDKTLETAATNNNFDEVFTQTMRESLKTYQTDLKNIYSTMSNQKQKQTLADAYNSVGVLLTEPTSQ